MIATLAITLLIESLIVIGYATWQKKPLRHLLFSSLCANLLTQSILWIILNLFPHPYIPTLFIAEICIWGMESLVLHLYRFNQLKFQEAMILSLMMNLTSFTIGCFLPI
jgi:hypothetical protein